jgi:hypothetical protein
MIQRTGFLIAATLILGGICMLFGFWPVMLILGGVAILYWLANRS